MGSGLVIVFEGGPSGLLGKTQRASTNLWVSVYLLPLPRFFQAGRQDWNLGVKSEIKVTNFVIQIHIIHSWYFEVLGIFSAPLQIGYLVYSLCILLYCLVTFSTYLWMMLFDHHDGHLPPPRGIPDWPRFRLLWPTKILCLALVRWGDSIHRRQAIFVQSWEYQRKNWTHPENSLYHHLKSYPSHSLHPAIMPDIFQSTGRIAR